MKIGRGYELKSDELNCTIYKVEKKNGKQLTRPVGYYSTPQNALKAFVDMKVRETQLRDLKTICGRIDELHGVIDRIKL